MAFKDFAAGEILTSSDVDLYLMQQVIIRCTSATRPPGPAQGWHIYETDTSKFLVYNGSAWVPESGQSLSVLKTANETVTNSNVRQNDDHLFLPVEANVNYWLDVFLVFNATTAADIYWGWAAPAGATMTWYTDSQDNFASSSFGPVGRDALAINTTTASTGGVGSDIVAPLRGVLSVAGTAGTLQFMWAQASANATGTIVKAGSAMRLIRF